MRNQGNLLCLRRRKFIVTTDSNSRRPAYPFTLVYNLSGTWRGTWQSRKVGWLWCLEVAT
jgi:hypothetical protein